VSEHRVLPAQLSHVERRNSDVAVLFSTDRQINMLRQATLIHIDSTFRVVPSLYCQLFIILVPYVDYTFPVVYALMSRKTKALSKADLNKVKNCT